MNALLKEMNVAVDMEEMLTHYSSFPLLRLKPVNSSGEIVAIQGGAHLDSSFKNLLATGMLRLAVEHGLLRHGQPVIESSSGSMGEGLAAAGRMLGHPIIIVTDPNLPSWTAKRITQLGAKLIIAPAAHPTLGWQEARENEVRRLLQENPDLFWLDQNNSPLNPACYERWLIPNLKTKIDPHGFDVAAFCVGSGGHFTAISKWLKSVNPAIKTFAVDRPGSITFGGTPAPSRLRGVGNQNMVPAVIAGHMHLVDGIERVDDGSAFRMCRRLGQIGCFVGGSSGAAYVAACRIAEQLSGGRVLTLFPDRGDIYSDTIWNDEWMATNGFMHNGEYQ